MKKMTNWISGMEHGNVAMVFVFGLLYSRKLHSDGVGVVLSLL